MTTYLLNLDNRPERGEVLEFDFVRFWVSNAQQAASYYTTRFGFNLIAYDGEKNGNIEFWSYVLRIGKITLVLTQPLSNTQTQVKDHLERHGDGVREIGFTVDEIEPILTRAVAKGATVLTPIHSISDEDGTVILAQFATYGDVVITLV
jgi:4-hydroxyphenylpyruvate dioxygenase